MQSEVFGAKEFLALGMVHKKPGGLGQELVLKTISPPLEIF